MPKKTKKAKILSEKRKKIKLLQPIVTPAETNSKINVKINQTKDNLPEENDAKNNFLNDFKRSLIIIVLIFTIEIILYFVSMSNYFPGIIRF